MSDSQACRDKTETLRSGKNSKRRESCCGRALVSDRISAKNTWPRARHRLRQFRRAAERARLLPDRQIPASRHISRSDSRGICQLLGVVCKASQFQAQFAMREETNNDSFFATAGRTAKELGQGQKLSHRELRQFKLIPAFGLKIVHEFEEQHLGGFHQIRPASLKLK